MMVKSFFLKKLSFQKNNRICYISLKIVVNYFDFLFYKGHYFLNAEADLDDFSLKLNHSKKEVSEFIKNNSKESFIELLNKNRVIYFQELLKSKKYKHFTIEALSEMSGFNNRRSMYNAFNKYVGLTPTDFIQSLK